MIISVNYKFEKLKKIIRNMQSVLVAYSGGVDSSLLLKVAKDTLGDNVLAVVAESSTYTKSEKETAGNFAKQHGVKCLIVKTDELNNPKFSKNPENRCYYCKDELFSKLTRIAKKYNLKYVVDGSNFDDRLDYRPGTKAKDKYNVRSPLFEAKLTKKEIRQLSKELNLSSAGLPSLACLASRFPYDLHITNTALKRVDKAETFIRGLGFSQVRVRHYDSLARIEVPKKEINRLIKFDNTKIVNKLKKLGYNYITVDLEGYRSGSMNETMK